MLWQCNNLGIFRWQKRRVERASPMPAFDPNQALCRRASLVLQGATADNELCCALQYVVVVATRLQNVPLPSEDPFWFSFARRALCRPVMLAPQSDRRSVLRRTGALVTSAKRATWKSAMLVHSER